METSALERERVDECVCARACTRVRSLASPWFHSNRTDELEYARWDLVSAAGGDQE